MEGLAAVGAASSIIQLVDFSLKLITTGTEIRDSLSGSSLQNEALEDVYQQMRSILLPVEGLAAANNNSSHSIPVEPGHRAIRTAAKTAHKDCSEILDLLEKLKLKSGGHKRWVSIVVAFKTMMGQKKILEIETRLRTELSLVSIELNKLTWLEVKRLNDNVAELLRRASDNGMQNDSQLEELARSFSDLSTTSRSEKDGAACNTATLLNDIGTLFERAKKYDSVKNITITKQAVINSLHFPSRARRHEAIPKNHQTTFEWIYRITSFQRWLEEGGIFWIHGKPGSGKSTLMKFLANNPHTHACLNKWAHPYKSTIAAHYFWNLGADMQKSLLGLMRTLVFEILRKSPDSIQSACPARWKMALEDEHVFVTQQKYDREGQWTMEELSETIKRLEQSEDGSIHSRLCLFVDGLDEFEGDHGQVCKLLISLARLPHVKMCLSSRPWNIFRDEFGNDETKQVAVHQLTGNDMKKFVHDHLVSHPSWSGGGPTCMINAEDKISLIDEIRKRANGVFLWVTLVTKSIFSGLRNQDTIHDLRERLRLLPTDLGNLFTHILKRVDSAYWKKSAEYLWIALHEKNGGLPPDAYYYHELDHENEKYAVEWPVEPSRLDDAPLPRQLDAQFASRRITALTGGLLEVSSHFNVVTFLHRTVVEFLLSRDISHEIRTRMRPNFDVHLALSKMLTVLFKRNRLSLQDLGPVVNMYLPLVDRLNFASTMNLIDALEETTIQRGSVKVLKEMLVQSPLSEQVSQKLSMNESYFSELVVPPAVLLLKDQAHIARATIEMLRVLGEHGQGMNRTESPHISPWATYFRRFPNNLNDINEHILSFGRLVAIGADPNAQVGLRNLSTQTVFSAYLILPFSSHARHLNLESYLGTLDVFLDHAAHFWQPITFTRYVSWWPEEIDLCCDSVEKAFSKGLKLLGSDTQMMASRGLVFQTVKRILSKRSDDAELMSRLRIAIPLAFPEHMAYSLLSMIPLAPPHEQPQKRKREGDELSDMKRPASGEERTVGR